MAEDSEPMPKPSSTALLHAIDSVAISQHKTRSALLAEAAQKLLAKL